MYVYCIHVCMCVCTGMYMCVYTCMYVCLYMYVCGHVIYTCDCFLAAVRRLVEEFDTEVSEFLRTSECHELLFCDR